MGTLGIGANAVGIAVGLYNLSQATSTSEKLQAGADTLASAIGFMGPLGGAFSGGYSAGQLGDQAIQWASQKYLGADYSPSNGIAKGLEMASLLFLGDRFALAHKLTK